MNIEEIREFCLTLNGVEECLPFGPDNLVFKVYGKIFAIMSLDEDRTMNLKCDPEWAVELREKHSFVLPGYHMNKKHWNTLQNLPIIENSFMKEMIVHSYHLVVCSLPKKYRPS